MLPAIESLLILQERDERVTQIQTELTRTPLEVSALEVKWTELCNKLHTRENEVKQTELERKKLNLDAASTKTQIAKYKTQQQQTRKNEEFQALIHEIQHGDKKLSEIEDRELELMEKVSELEKTVAAEKLALKEKESEFNQRREDLKKKKASLEQQLTEALSLQKESEGNVEEALFKRYRRILTSRKTKAIVPVSHGVCGGCHMKLTTQNAVQIRAGKEIASCDNCGRLAYWLE